MGHPDRREEKETSWDFWVLFRKVLADSAPRVEVFCFGQRRFSLVEVVRYACLGGERMMTVTDSAEGGSG